MNCQTQLAFLLQQGYCCTEALVRLGLWLKGEENPLLASASAGLCNGMHAGFTCGALAGGCMLLSMFDRPLAARVLIPQLCEWFDAEFGMAYGSVNCEDLRRGPDRCRALIRSVAEQCVLLLRENQLLEEPIC